MTEHVVTAADFEQQAREKLDNFLASGATRLTVNLEGEPHGASLVGAYAMAFFHLSQGVGIEMSLPKDQQVIIFERK